MQPTRWFVCGRPPARLFMVSATKASRSSALSVGKTHHKVELDEAPACRIDLSHGIQQVAFADSLC